ncbi:hypothetical protein C8R42DRAFT_775427 [Lentinula raphanica]|nr:hypothetical protein C8R42DRAFT_775427 [Lentinula raphanica]
MLSLASQLRSSTSCSARVTRHQLRHASRTIKPAPHALSPEKMRALISLYHQSETYITPENLSERIDEAFTEKQTADKLAFGLQKAGVDNLSQFYTDAKLAPKFSEWNREKMRFGEGIWSKATYSRREWKVVEALYGVDASGPLEPMPGLEALEEGEDAKIGLPPEEVVIKEGVDERIPQDGSRQSQVRIPTAN